MSAPSGDVPKTTPKQDKAEGARTAPAPGEPGRFAFLASSLPFRDLQLPHALQEGPFRSYWTSQLVALSGSWMQNTASSLVVLSLTSSALLIGAINVVSAIPLLLLSLHGGVVADRFDRRKIVLTSQVLVGMISLVYAFLIIADHLAYWHVLVLAAVAGTIMAFSLPASQSFVADLVSREDLPEAMALNSASFNATRTVGPALAGIVIGILGTASAFLINAVTLLAPISTLVRLKDAIPAHRSQRRGSGGSAMREGMGYIRSHDDVLGLVLLSAVFSFLVFPNLLVLMPLYIDDVLGGGDGWVSIMISVLGLGSLAGSIGILRGSRLEAAAGKRLRRAMAGLAIGLVWLGLVPNVGLDPSPWLAVPGVLIAGHSFTTGNTQITTTLQQLAPDDMRGRVLSANSLAFNGVMPFATIAIAGLSQLIGQSIVMLICAALMVGSCVWLWRRYVWRAFVPAQHLVARNANAA
ncbi:MAG TPA: MFS transporter [Thermomicrobiales bacterium]|nr:MFS transporter [Thermomicrobiales bacterium]